MKKNNRDSDEEKRARRIKSERRHRRNVFVKLSVVAIFLYIMFTYVIGIYRVNGNNMYPHLKDGDLVFTYRLFNASIGDPVVYKIDGIEKAGRIEALPGQVFDINKSGEIEINGSIVSEEVFYPTAKENLNLKLPYKVKDGEVIILNDYRTDEKDSRAYGAIPISDLDGEIILVHRRRGI